MSKLTDSQATRIVQSAWTAVHGREPTTLERLYTQSIARLETGYGRVGQFADFADQGKFNWGAEQRKVNADGTCPPGFVLGKDQGTVCFYFFPSDEEAAKRYIGVLTKSTRRPNVIYSMGGTPEDVATAMRGINPATDAYYAGVSGSEADRIAVYANLIRQNAKAIGEYVEKNPSPAPQPARGDVSEFDESTESGRGFGEQSKATGIVAGLIVLGIGGALVHQTLKIKTKQTV